MRQRQQLQLWNFVFETLGLSEIVSFTTTLNTRSLLVYGTSSACGTILMVTSSTRAYLRETRSARTCSTAWCKRQPPLKVPTTDSLHMEDE